ASCARGGGRGRELLVVAQLAMALALVTCAGLMIKSILTLRAIDPGLETRQLLTMRVTPGGKAYEEQGRRAAFFQAAAHGIRQIPGVVSAAAVSTVPLSGSGTGMSFTIEDERAVVTGRARLAGFMVVTPGYFQTMNIPLLAGRDFTEFDTSETEGVVIVSKGLAELLWPGENPLGRRLKHAPRDDPDPWLTVIGVVGDVRHFGLDQGFRHETYRPLAQQGSRAATFVARTIGDPLRAATAARRAVHEIDPDLAVYGVQSMEDIVVASVGESGILAKVLAAFATIALVLAAVGLYGVVSYAVNQRTREIGIRIVLGARPQDALRLIISRSLLLTVLGIAVGVGLALALAQTLESLMYGVSPADPATLVGTAALLIAVALLASYIPARRATKVDPMVALRYE
ncbi:MAG: ABC transporter permease, partial [Phycisphaerales bacterium]